MGRLEVTFVACLVLLSIAQAAWQEQAKLTDPDGAGGDYLGHSVSVSGNYAIVGAVYDDGMCGSACLFHYSNLSWSFVTKLTASDREPNDRFGVSVSISGDYAIVGAYQDQNENGSLAGSAYIYERSGTDWTQKAKLTDPSGAAEDRFGHSVSITGDYAIVGAYNDGESGSAHVYQRAGDTWSHVAKLVGSNTSFGDRFGWSVALTDGYAIVGAPYDDLQNDNSGTAYVFEKPETGWADMTETSMLAPSDGDGSGDNCGQSVSIDGTWAVVGGRTAQGGLSRAGAAYLFDLADMTERAKLTASDKAVDDLFGICVSIGGDRVVAGAYHDYDTSGSAYIFEKPETGWANMTETDILIPFQGVADDRYGGSSVSISGNFAIVAAGYDDQVAANAGAAYVFVPEPTVLALLALGGAGLIRRRRK